MQIQTSSDNIEISPSMKSLAEQKLQKLEHSLISVPEDLKIFRVVMNTAKDDQFEVKISATVRGKEYFSQEYGYTLENALIMATENMHRELDRNNELMKEKNWKQARDAKHFDAEVALEEEINA